MALKNLSAEAKVCAIRKFSEADRPLEVSKEHGTTPDTLFLLAGRLLDSRQITQSEYSRFLTTVQRPVPFPRGNEKRLETLLPAAFNRTTKNALLLLLGEKPQSTGVLVGSFLGVLGDTWSPRMPRSLCRQYVNDSLAPAGLVARKVISENGEEALGHVLTGHGEMLGQPLSAYSFDFESRHNITTFEILGSATSWGDSRAPYNRFRILEEVLQSDSLSIHDISQAIDVDESVVSKHLHALRAAGTIEFDSVSTEEHGWARYEWISKGKPRDVPAYPRQARLTKEVTEILYLMGEADYNEITDAIKSRYGKQRNKYTVSGILSFLREKGFASSGLHGRSHRSEISFTARGRRIANELTKMLRGAMKEGAVLDSMRKQAFALAGNQNALRRTALATLKRYVKISPDINAEPAETTNSKIFSMLRGRGPSRPIVIAEGINATVSGTEKRIKALLAAGVLQKERKGRFAFYGVPDSNE